VSHKIPLDEHLLVNAVRYALEGHHGMTILVANAVRGAWPELSLSARGIILRDVRDALDEPDTKLTHVHDHRTWVALLTDIVQGNLSRPAAEGEELGPDDGYPSEDELLHLAAFRGTARELMEYVESIWRGGAGVRTVRRDNGFGREEVAVTFVTGGWSGCESVISVLNRTLARIYASRWERGGLHEFAFPDTVYDSDKSWDWAFPAGDPDATDGPYREVRDRLAALEAKVVPA